MNASMTFDPGLLQRYDKAGPRYTSYPTAVQFNTAFNESTLREQIRRSNAELIPRQLSLYLHIPYCFSPCFYCGCTRIITRDRSRGRAYVERLVREIAMVGQLFDRDREVIQLHLGGGTPNFLQSAELGELMDSLVSHFHLSSSKTRDYSVELDPRTVEDGDIALYGALGFNRASLGVQDFDPVVQQAVNRVQSVEQTLKVIEACRAERFSSVNVDLIYGLPKQTAAGFGRTLDIVMDARPDRLAIYGYAHMPHLFKGQRQIDAADLPSATAKLDLLRLAIDKLTAAGYVYVGMDHFALPDDDLVKAYSAGTLHRNFMGYTTHAHCDLVGLGMSAISHISDSFSQNARDVAAWGAALDAGRLPLWRGKQLDTDDVVRADVIQQLMCLGRVDVAEIERRHDVDFPLYFAAEIGRLQPLIADGLATMDADCIAVTSRGRLLVRIIAMCFDRYLNTAHSPGAPAAYSRVV